MQVPKPDSDEKSPSNTATRYDLPSNRYTRQLLRAVFRLDIFEGTVQEAAGSCTAAMHGCRNIGTVRTVPAAILSGLGFEPRSVSSGLS